MSAETKRTLEAAADASGRSISQEAELWLEAAQRDRRFLHNALALAYGEKVAGLLIYLGELLRSVASYRTFAIETFDPQRVDPFDDPWRFEMMVQAVRAAIERFRPKGAIKSPRQTAIFPPSSPHDRADFEAFKKKIAARAEQELKIGVTLEQVRFNHLSDMNHPDPARDLLGNLVRRGTRGKRGNR